MYTFKTLTFILFTLCIPRLGMFAQNPASHEQEAISLKEALAWAIAADPRLQVYAARQEAAEGQIEQAGLVPNPTVALEVENFLGTGPLRGVDGAEITIGISQLIETAGKRQKRTALARAERNVLEWERESILSELEAAVRAAFIDVLLAQQRLDLRKEQHKLAARSAVETARLVEAALSPQVDLTRAQLAVRQQQFAVQGAQRELEAARVHLASLWGDAEPMDFKVIGEIRPEPNLPEFPDLVARLDQTATMSRFLAEEKTRTTALELEQAQGKPDLEVFGAARYFKENGGDAGFVVGVEIPWPVFDKNQGNIRTARAHLRSLEHERAATRRALLVSLKTAYQEMLSAHAEVESIEADLIPAAEATLSETEAGYERGQFTQLAVLESRSTFFEIREAYLEALSRYVTSQSEIATLTRPATIQP